MSDTLEERIREILEDGCIHTCVDCLAPRLARAWQRSTQTLEATGSHAAAEGTFIAALEERDD